MNKLRVLQPLSIAGLAFALGLVVASGRIAEAQGVAPALPAAVAKSWCAERCDDVVTDWSLTAYHVIKAGDGYQDPMSASRSLAMMHLAMHDAVNAVHPRYEPYALAPRAVNGTQADAAVAAVVAAHDVLAALYPQEPAQALLRSELQRSLFDAGVGRAVDEGRRVGKAAASAVLAKRSADGSGSREAYVLRTGPGQYRYTAPFDFAAAPHWRRVTPFALTSPAQFRSPAPPPLDSEQYREAYDEVKRVGGKHAGAARTPDETQYAAFWYEFSDIGWNRIARGVSSRVEQDLGDRARTFALLNMALADSYIAGWDSKYHHNSWRPVTAIRLAAEDGNPRTIADPGFETLLTTPPVPDSPSTHSVLGMAGATVLAHAFGRDSLPFSFASPTALPEAPVRTFQSFSQAARENADSRVKAGLHFRFATTAGLEMGKRIGEHVTHNALKPSAGR